MNAVVTTPILSQLPTEQEARLAGESSRLLAACIGHGAAARLRVTHGDQEIEVPGSALLMLVGILAQMARGNAVSIVPIHAELTTQEGADFLNVARPFLVGLLDCTCEVQFAEASRHQRVLAQASPTGC